MTTWGGRAMCPADEWGDLELCEEMFWHALEEALTDAGLLQAARRWPLPPVAVPNLGAEITQRLPWGLVATWRAVTDEHLGEDSSGLIDLTCTLTRA